MLLKEEIGRQYKTLNNDPIPHDWPDHVKVETYANDEGSWSVKVDCTTHPELSAPLRKFQDEQSATFYANQQVDNIKRQTMNESLKTIIRKILIEQYIQW